MSKLFYIIKEGKQKGPFTPEELTNKQVMSNTLVWTEGFAHWVIAAEIKALAAIIKPGLEEPIQQEQIIPLPTPITITLNLNYFDHALAKRRDRFFACIIETILHTIIWIFIYKVIEPKGFYDLISIGRSTLYSAIYGAITYPLFSGKIGHKIMGLKVISSEDGSDFKNPLKGAFRQMLKFLFGLLFIPSVWLLWDDKLQNLYDKVVKTLVVQKKTEANT